MNHTHEHTHVSCHDYSHSFHHKTLFFSPGCKPCKLFCCVLHRFTHMLCRFELLFLYLSVIVLSLAYLFLNYFCYVYISLCLVLHVQVTLPSISLVVIIVSAQNGSMSCQTHASTVCSYPMASSTWSCPNPSMSLMWMCFTHATGLCVTHM